MVEDGDAWVFSDPPRSCAGPGACPDRPDATAAWVQQPILMRGNRRQSPARCHSWGIATTLGRGRLLQDFFLGGHHRGQIRAQILDVLRRHLTGPWTHCQIPEEPGLLLTSTYNPQVAPMLIHHLDMPLQGLKHNPGVAIVLMNKQSWRGGSRNFTS